jgi:hypothetical protein
LILSENPQKAIPFTSITKYEFLSNWVLVFSYQ